MARPQNLQTLDGASSTGSGEEYRQKGHPNVTLSVVASNLDTANDTLAVDLEYSPRGENWESIAQVSQDDFSDGEIASLRLSEVALEHLRANITSFNDASGDDLAVDAYLLLNGNQGSGRTGREVS